MPTLSPGQFNPLYHGTGAALRPGDVIEPRSSPMRGGSPRAFASPHRAMADSYARYVNTPKSGQLSMLGHVYEVEPVDPADVHETSQKAEVQSGTGFKVKRHVASLPILDEKD